MSNKNKSGIDNFLNHQRLFNRDKVTYNKVLTGYRVNEAIQSGRASMNRTNHYHLLSQVNRDNKQDTNKNKDKDKDEIAEYADNYHVRSVSMRESSTARKGDGYGIANAGNNNKLQAPIIQNTTNKVQQNATSPDGKQNKPNNPTISQSLQMKPTQVPKQAPNQSLKKRQALSREVQVMGTQPPIVQQKPASMQTLVIKSSHKYFDSCRGQALNYIQKMQHMLIKQSRYIQQSILKINKDMQQYYSNVGQQLKQTLYKIVDQSIQQWQIQQMHKYSKQQINYIGQLLQLNTQVQQRYKQVGVYRVELDDDKYWKIRASDLLTSNYQADLIQLSKMCKKAVQCSQENVGLYLDIMHSHVNHKIQDNNNIGGLSNLICAYLTSKHDGSKEQKNKQIVGDSKLVKKQSEKSYSQLKTVKKQVKQDRQSGTHAYNQTYLSPSVKIATLTVTPSTAKYHRQQVSPENSRQRRMTAICQTCHRQMQVQDNDKNNPVNSYRASYPIQDRSSPIKKLHTFNSSNSIQPQPPTNTSNMQEQNSFPYRNSTHPLNNK